MPHIQWGPITPLMLCPLILAHYHYPWFVCILKYVLLRTIMHVQDGTHILLIVVRVMHVACLYPNLSFRLVNRHSRQRRLTDSVRTLLLTVSYSPTPKAQFVDSFITHWLLKFSYQNGGNKRLIDIDLYAKPGKPTSRFRGSVCVHPQYVANRFSDLKQCIRIVILYRKLVQPYSSCHR